MKLAKKYLFLIISFFGLLSVGFILFYKYLKAKEFAKKDGGIQSGYDALNLEIINVIYGYALLIIVIIHIILLIIFIFEDKRKKNV
ncbi:hypothetical protein [Chengkuizengella axinellae]|uniref:Uncharacterized protein n=1 Tax=Chengkuizengella axinellae TaxID=3064388 RepID=A0ABT9IUB1_9BACL|nr:hypothetical protein [Chengkuizengella sp. 2205SS18-9]MDP5272913.1 hypothetical protein [Chengkuizengella sp. 2205SS18-9]